MMEREDTGVWSRLEVHCADHGHVKLSELLHPVLADAGIGAWRYEPMTGRLYFDELLRERYGLPPIGPLRLEQLLECVHENDRIEFGETLNQAAETGTFRYRHRATLVDGTERWFDWTGRSNDGNNGFGGVLGVCVDVTRQAEAQRKLAAERNWIHAIANGVPGKFGYMDDSFRVQFLSKEFRVALGLDDDQFKGRHPREVFGEAVFEQRRALMERAMAGEVVAFEDSGTAEDENTFLDTVTYRPDFDNDGNVRGIFTLRVNINSRRELEQSLRSMSEDLARSNADLEQFAYVASMT